MRRTISYTLLITLIILSGACNQKYTAKSTGMNNIMVTDAAAPVDSQLVYLYMPQKKELEENISKVISISREQMIKDKPESNLTNFLADLLLQEGKKAMQETGQQIVPDISYFNYGGIRTTLPRGEITVGKVFELMPFENEMVLLQLTGHQVKEFLDVIAIKGGDSVGGARFLIKGNKAANIKIGKEPLKTTKDYWMVTNDYIASGGDGMELLTRRNKIINTNKKIRDVIINYMESQHTQGDEIYVVPDGRIRYSSQN